MTSIIILVGNDAEQWKLEVVVISREEQYKVAWNEHVQNLLEKKETGFNREEYKKYYNEAMKDLSLND